MRHARSVRSSGASKRARGAEQDDHGRPPPARGGLEPRVARDERSKPGDARHLHDDVAAEADEHDHPDVLAPQPLAQDEEILRAKGDDDAGAE